MLVLHGNALRYGLICRQQGKQKQVIHKTTLYLLKLSTNIRLFVCWGRHPQIKAEQNSYHQNVWKNK